MDKAFIREHHVVERYLQGKLEGEELTAFEVYMLDHPEIVDDIEYARGMLEALVAAKEELIDDSAPQSRPAGRARFWLSREHALAATVLLGIAVVFSGYLYREIGDLTEEVATLRNPLPIADEVWLEPVRGARQRVIERRQGPALVLRIDVSATAATSYTATISDEQSDFFWSQPRIAPDDQGSIRLLVAGLPDGEYRLSVSADDDDGVSEPFAVYRFLLQSLDE